MMDTPHSTSEINAIPSTSSAKNSPGIPMPISNQFSTLQGNSREIILKPGCLPSKKVKIPPITIIYVNRKRIHAMINNLNISHYHTKLVLEGVHVFT